MDAMMVWLASVLRRVLTSEENRRSSRKSNMAELDMQIIETGNATSQLRPQERLVSHKNCILQYRYYSQTSSECCRLSCTSWI
jgi:hypothetical protein